MYFYPHIGYWYVSPYLHRLPTYLIQMSELEQHFIEESSPRLVCLRLRWILYNTIVIVIYNIINYNLVPHFYFTLNNTWIWLMFCWAPNSKLLLGGIRKLLKHQADVEIYLKNRGPHVQRTVLQLIGEDYSVPTISGSRRPPRLRGNEC